MLVSDSFHQYRVDCHSRFLFLDDEFFEYVTPTIGVDFKTKTMNVRDKTIELQLWDTAGQEKFFNLTRNYYVSVLIECLFNSPFCLFYSSREMHMLLFLSTIVHWQVRFNMSNVG